MSIGNADICKAIVSLWVLGSLDSVFNTYWSVANRTEFPVLNHQQAESSQPFPYCVFDVDKGHPIGRMSGSGNTNQELRDIPCKFVVHAKNVNGVSAMTIASNLAAAIMAIFGGHPTIKAIADNYALNNGGILIFQFQGDFGIREDIENYAWSVDYTVKADIPIAV